MSNDKFCEIICSSDKVERFINEKLKSNPLFLHDILFYSEDMENDPDNCPLNNITSMMEPYEVVDRNGDGYVVWISRLPDPSWSLWDSGDTECYHVTPCIEIYDIQENLSMEEAEERMLDD